MRYDKNKKRSIQLKLLLFKIVACSIEENALERGVSKKNFSFYFGKQFNGSPKDTDHYPIHLLPYINGKISIYTDKGASYGKEDYYVGE